MGAGYPWCQAEAKTGKATQGQGCLERSARRETPASWPNQRPRLRSTYSDRATRSCALMGLSSSLPIRRISSTRLRGTRMVVKAGSLWDFCAFCAGFLAAGFLDVVVLLIFISYKTGARNGAARIAPSRPISL